MSMIALLDVNASSFTAMRADQTKISQLLNRLAEKVDQPAVNAHCDTVWRLIPAVNGVRLNIPATLSRITWKDGTVLLNQVSLVFDQIPPQVTNQDLVAEPIYRGNRLKHQMALMFNVAWGTEYIEPILNVLHATHVQATFFLAGSWAQQHPAVAKQILAAGMELGNHAFNHPLMSRLGRDAMISQITRTNGAIQKAVGMRPILFAPPAGDYNTLVVRVAAGLSMRTVLWSLDTIDWKRPQPQVIVSRIVNRRAPGMLVLMHPTAPTVAALPEMIRDLQNDGYELVTVSNLINPVRPTMKTLQEGMHLIQTGGTI